MEWYKACLEYGRLWDNPRTSRINRIIDTTSTGHCFDGIDSLVGSLIGYLFPVVCSLPYVLNWFRLWLVAPNPATIQVFAVVGLKDFL